MTIVAILCFGVANILFGAGLYSIYQKQKVKELVKLFKKQLLQAYDEGIKYGGIKPMIDRVNAISKEQTVYLASLDNPNANSLHAKHKNTIISIIKSLEEEKYAIFKSILQEGQDPRISVILEGKQQVLSISELLKIITPNSEIETKIPKLKTESNISSGTRVLRLVQNTEGYKNDNSNPEIH
jgi:hypothetical protein